MKRQSTGGKTAFDYRGRLQRQTGFTDQDLKSLPVWDGDRFDEGEQYVNLAALDRGAFRATVHDFVNPDGVYVRKSDVAGDVWSRIITGSNRNNVPAGDTSYVEGAFGKEGSDQINVSQGGSGAADIHAPFDSPITDEGRRPHGH